ncbi:MAG: methionyl-tRNA formyltransferase [Synergistaceae bacterium]|nr:methionyl-tRNA formyltransferase [Synergistaceae bacterium]
MRIWFIGTGKFAALCLENFIKRDIKFERIITGLPTKSGRGNKEKPSQVELAALKLNLSVTRAGLLSQEQELINEINNNAPDLIFVIDFGQIIKEPFLNAAKFGCLNIHPSVLPKWRGAAPVQRALMNGDDLIGVTVFRLVKAMDAGGILAQEALSINKDVGAAELYEKLSALGVELAVNKINAGELNNLIMQDESLASYADKISRSEFEVNFNFTAEKFNNYVRALDASGGAFIVFNNRRLKIWNAHVIDDIKIEEKPGEFLGIDKERGGVIFKCADKAISLIEVQAEGKNKMSGLDWARGQRII